MSNLFGHVKEKLYHLNGADVDTVLEAEKKMGIRFSPDYRNYLMEYGVVSFGSHEWMGLGGAPYLDVVEETLAERERNQRFPKDCYIVENLGIDGVFILQNEEGMVYQLSDAGLRKIGSCLEDYILTL